MANSPPLAHQTKNGRYYSHPVTGVLVPSVTTVLDNGIPKQDVLVGWTAKKTALYAIENAPGIAKAIAAADGNAAELDRIYKKIRDARFAPRPGQTRPATQLGSDVHAACEAILLGDNPETDDEVGLYVQSFVRFLQERKPQVEVAECTVWSHRRQYAGTCDLICRLPDTPGTTIIDYKTGGIYAEVALQLSAYAWADCIILRDGTELEMPKIDYGAVLDLKPEGYRLLPVAIDEEQLKVFLYARAVAYWKAEVAPTVIGNPL